MACFPAMIRRRAGVAVLIVLGVALAGCGFAGCGSDDRSDAAGADDEEDQTGA